MSFIHYNFRKKMSFIQHYLTTMYTEFKLVHKYVTRLHYQITVANMPSKDAINVFWTMSAGMISPAISRSIVAQALLNILKTFIFFSF